MPSDFDRSKVIFDVRPARIDDLPRAVQICNEAWKGIFQTDVQTLSMRINAFPDGGVITGLINGIVEGYLSIQLINGTTFPTSWDQATDNGRMISSHKLNGDWVFGLGIAVSTKGSKYGLTNKILQYGWDYVVANRKKGALFVTRIPSYYIYKNIMSPEEYVLCKKHNHPIDSELRVWERYGFNVVDPPMILKDYVKGGGDPNSCGFGVLVKKENIFY